MPGDGDNPSRELHTIRDSVEGVWVAIVLAFVLRAFLIEAFVIPTGSMAPRLLGEHWSLQCPADGYEYDYGLGSDPAVGTVSRRRRSSPADARCPNCGYPYNLSQEKRYLRSGDRVLVLKYLYHFREPRPWDVVVFKNPQNNRENYIKRLIALPGETIEIVHGDIFISTDGAETFRIRRKPPRAQEATWQVVFDNDYRAGKGVIESANRTRQRVRPPRWTALEQGAGRWDLDGLNGRRFSFAGGDPAELRFEAPRSRFLPWYGYNAARVMRTSAVDEQRDVCTDLKLSFMFVPRGPGARVGLEMSSFGHRFRGEVDADGAATLRYLAAGEQQWQVWASETIDPLAPGEAVEVAMEHVDLSLKLRVGGRTVLEVTDGRYPFDYAWLKARMERANAHAVPRPEVRIGASGGASELWHVKLMRDVHYTCPPQREIPNGVVGDYARDVVRRSGGERNIGQHYPGWGTTGNPITLRDRGNDDLDEFFVLGDNSPQSLDGRSWTWAAPSLRLYDEQHRPQYRLGTVPRYCLTGRALLVYWPAGFRLPGLPGLPLVPNVGRMRLIR
jgi:signal peptidase I